MALTNLEEDEVCRLYQDGKLARECGEAFGVSQQTVLRLLRMRGIPARKRGNPRTPHEQAIIADFIAGDRPSEIAKRYGVNISTVRGRVLAAGLKYWSRSKSQRHHDLDESAFAEVTDESAYWLGLLLADGCVKAISCGDPGNTLTLTACEKDAAHVESFKVFLKSSAPVHRLLNTCQGKQFPSRMLSVHSQRLVADVMRHGIMPRKSLTATVPEHLKDNVHFWRGVIDGDGSVLWRRYPGQQAIPLLSLCGTEAVCRGFLEFARRMGSEADVIVRRDKANLWSVRVSGRHAVQVAGWLYSHDGPALARKHATAKSFPDYRPHEFSDWSQVTREKIIEAFDRLGSWDAVAVELGVKLSTLKLRRGRVYGIYIKSANNRKFASGGR